MSSGCSRLLTSDTYSSLRKLRPAVSMKINSRSSSSLKAAHSSHGENTTSSGTFKIVGIRAELIDRGDPVRVRRNESDTAAGFNVCSAASFAIDVVLPTPVGPTKWMTLRVPADLAVFEFAQPFQQRTLRDIPDLGLDPGPRVPPGRPSQFKLRFHDFEQPVDPFRADFLLCKLCSA